MRVVVYQDEWQLPAEHPARSAQDPSEIEICRDPFSGAELPKLDLHTPGDSLSVRVIIRDAPEMFSRLTAAEEEYLLQSIANILYRMIEGGQEVVSHNMEPVGRLYRMVRPQAKYERSLEQIKRIREAGKRTKSGIMLGLGETHEEVFKAMDDLVQNGLLILTLGQYLQPTKMHLEVAEFIHPDTFAMYKEEGLKRGLKYVESGPLVRSSYHAERHVNVPLE